MNYRQSKSIILALVSASAFFIAGEIKHAIRFTVRGANNSYLLPARQR